MRLVSENLTVALVLALLAIFGIYYVANVSQPAKIIHCDRH